ncbi:hypothetical protein H5410_045719, partial [Solanum commersonii]
NSSQVSDGAAAVLLMKRSIAMQKGLPILGVFREMFDKERIAKLKKGVLIVNNARGAIMDTQAVVDACNNGHIAGYNGDVWYPQPAPKDHLRHYMPNQAMTPHILGLPLMHRILELRLLQLTK